jgi:uncharacterized membrane protein (DUF4010 family)
VFASSALLGQGQLLTDPLATDVVRIVLAGALGLFLGLEREWSQKTAGIRTFSLVSLLGAVFVVLDTQELPIGGSALLVVGGVLVIVQGILLAIQGLLEDSGLSLTTSVSLMVAYGVGALVAAGLVIEGVTVAVVSSLLLVLKRELHSIAWGLTREELRSATEFAILAFVIYPLLPGGSISLELGAASVRVEPRIAWTMVVTVAGIGIVNYAIVQNYGGRGIAITGFFGGLAASTAVVGTMLDHARQRPEVASYAAAAVLLAISAAAIRNLAIAIVFTINHVRGALLTVAVPLGAVAVGAIATAALTADWSEGVDLSLDSPFKLRNVLGFGLVFSIVLVAGAFAEVSFGTLGFFAATAATGLVSSGGATTSAVVLYRSQEIDGGTATIGILLATATSIGVKAILTAFGPNKTFARRVAIPCFVLLLGAGAVALLVV